MTNRQEQFRLTELALLAPVLVNGNLWPLIYATAKLASELRVAESEGSPARCLLVVMHQVALSRLGSALFAETLCTPLCGPESPDLAGATAVVNAVLSGNLRPSNGTSRRATAQA